MIDNRLLGTWKSDRKKTFAEYVPRRRVSAVWLRKFKSIFGKLVIRYTPRKFICDYDGNQETVSYQVLGKDSDSVVIRFYSDLWNEWRVDQLHFDGHHYWVWTYGLREFFKKVSD